MLNVEKHQYFWLYCVLLNVVKDNMQKYFVYTFHIFKKELQSTINKIRT